MENAKKVILGGKTQSQTKHHPFSLSCDGCWLGAVTSKESSYSGTMEEVWGTGSKMITDIDIIWGLKSPWSIRFALLQKFTL